MEADIKLKRKTFMKKSAVVALAGLISLSALTGCANNEEMAKLNARLDSMEDKTNKALRQSAAAKVDAATALHISQDK
jgi:outer membrane murein-binding lipoprotein Lpp